MMSTPERELPPLRVKILGDNSSYKKAVREAEDLAKGLEEHVKRVSRGVGGVGADKETVRRIKQMNKAFQEQRKQDDAVVKRHTDAINKEYDLQSKADVDRQKEIEKTRNLLAKQKEQYLKDINDQADRDQKQVLADRKARIDRLKDEDQAYRDRTKADDKLVAARNRADKETSSNQNKLAADWKKQNASMWATVEKQQKSEAAATEKKLKTLENIRKHFAKSNTTPAQARVSNGGLGLGNRADLYMHTAGIRNVAGIARGFLEAAAEWEQMSVQMEGFVGGAKEAERVMAQLQEHAIKSPYSMQEIGNSTRLMLAYGQSADMAMETTKMLGDVAGGSNEKLSRLSLGMAQITSIGKLQGQELRQLTEHGFNPLMTIARETAKDKTVEGIKKRYAELDAMKRKGLISSEAVMAALRVETSLGGKFYGMSDRMSKSLQGLVQQMHEYFVIMQRIATNSVKGDITTALESTIVYMKETNKWMENNKQAVREWAKFAMNIGAAVVAFHALGIAVAGTSWAVWSLKKIWTALTTTIAGAQMALTLFTAAGRASAMSSIVSTLGAGGPVALGIGAIAIAIGAATYATYHWLARTSELNAELSRSADIFDRLRQAQSNRDSAILMDAGKIRDPGERKKFLEGSANQIGMDISQMSANIKKQQAYVKSLDTDPVMGEGYGGAEYGAQNALLQEQITLLKDKQRIYDEINKAIGEEAKAGPDWESLLSGSPDSSKKSGKKSMYHSAPDHAMYKSSEHAKRLFDYSMSMNAKLNGDPKEDKQTKANQFLERIEKNTRPGGPVVEMNTAGLQGAPR